MSLLVRVQNRQSRTFSLTAATSGTGTAVGWSDGDTGLGVFGSIGDSSTLSNPLRVNGCGVHTIICEPGTANYYIYFEGNGEITYSSLATLAATQFFERILIKNAANTVIANMPKSSGTYFSGRYRWLPLAGGSPLVAGTTYSVEIS
jgi:hypothetical protein